MPGWIAGPILGIVSLLALANKRFGVHGGVTDPSPRLGGGTRPAQEKCGARGTTVKAYKPMT